MTLASGYWAAGAATAERYLHKSIIKRACVATCRCQRRTSVQRRGFVMKQKAWVGLFGGALMAAALAAQGQTQEHDRARVQAQSQTQPQGQENTRNRGESLYAQHCAACHRAQTQWRGKRAATDAASLRTQGEARTGAPRKPTTLRGSVRKRSWGRWGGWRRNGRKARHMKQRDLLGPDGCSRSNRSEEPAAQESEGP